MGTLATRLDELFHHRVKRKVRKDATVSYQGERFEVPYELSSQRVVLVVDPSAEQVLGVEDAEGQTLGTATPLDAVANVQRKRRKPRPAEAPSSCDADGDNEVELAYGRYYGPTGEVR